MKNVKDVYVDNGYVPLADVLMAALHRAQRGKGKERHAVEGAVFTEQPIMAVPRTLSPSDRKAQMVAPLFQAVKKIYECNRLASDEAVRNELLDAIVYVAAAVLLLEPDFTFAPPAALARPVPRVVESDMADTATATAGDSASI